MDFIIDAFIKKAEWTFAKSMPEAPHEYTLRKDHENKVFDKAILFIRHRGVPEKFYSDTYVYYYHNDGYKYWTMGAPVEETTIINRAKENLSCG